MNNFTNKQEYTTPRRGCTCCCTGSTDTSLGGSGLENVNTSGVSTRAEVMARCERECIDAGVKLFDSILRSQQEAEERMRQNGVIFSVLDLAKRAGRASA